MSESVPNEGSLYRGVSVCITVFVMVWTVYGCCTVNARSALALALFTLVCNVEISMLRGCQYLPMGSIWKYVSPWPVRSDHKVQGFLRCC